MRTLVLICAGLGLWGGWTLPASAQDDATKEILKKAIDASGGEEKINAAKAATAKGKGTISIAGQSLPFTMELFSQLPDKLKIVLDLDAGGNKVQIVQVYNGKKGWMQLMGMTMDLNDDQLKEAQESMHVEEVTRLVPLKGAGYKVTALGEAKVGGKEAVGLRVTKEGRRDVNLFFDKTSFLLVKAEYRAKDPAGAQEVNQEKFFSNYKEIAGVKTPMKMVVKNDGNDFLDIEVTDASVVERHDPSVFAKPE